MLDCLRAAAASGVAVVASLHQVGYACTDAARIVALRDGRVVDDVPADRVDPRALDAIYGKNGGARS